MMGTNLKAEIMSLMEKRSALEADMNAIIDRLCQSNGPGLSGNLVDSEVLTYSIIILLITISIRWRKLLPL